MCKTDRFVQEGILDIVSDEKPATELSAVKRLEWIAEVAGVVQKKADP